MSKHEQPPTTVRFDPPLSQFETAIWAASYANAFASDEATSCERDAKREAGGALGNVGSIHAGRRARVEFSAEKADDAVVSLRRYPPSCDDDQER